MNSFLFPSAIRKFYRGLQGSLQAGALSAISRKPCPGPVTIACVFSIGERTEEQCIESIRTQTEPVSRIEVIRQVSPISRASNRALVLAQDADLLLWVDADMILYPHCSEHLARLMRKDALYAVAPLLDPVFGKVGYIKLLNMHIVRRLGLRFRDVLGCDVDFCRQAHEQDPTVIPETYTLARRPLGIHHPRYTARELFRKNQIEKKKRGNRMDARILSMLVRRYNQSPSPILLAGILGEVLPNPDVSKGESGPESGLHQWDMVKEMLGNIPDHATFGFPDNELRGFGH